MSISFISAIVIQGLHVQNTCLSLSDYLYPFLDFSLITPRTL